MTLILIIWIALILLEVLVNWWIIEKKKRSPNHWIRSQVRVGVGFVFWCVTPFLFPDINSWQWFLGQPLMQAFSFWWIFDTVLALSRGKKAIKLDVASDKEEDASTDQWQQSHGGERLWFWIKLGLAVGSTALFIWI